MKTSVKNVLRMVLLMLLAMGIGALIITLIGQNPLEAYYALFKGAFGSKLSLGTTIAKFTPLLLTSVAFSIAFKGGAFNVGVEGEVFLGGLAAAYVGIYWDIPGPLHIILCFAAAMIVGALWALIPAALKTNFGVSEVCVTILMNYVALYITSYAVSGPMSAGVANAQSLPVAENVRLLQFMKPSSANTGLFIAIIAALIIIWMLSKTSFGYKIRNVGTNPEHAEFAGISPKETIMKTMMISGAIGGAAGCIEILGVHGYFLNNFAANLGSNGMLAALIVKCNIPLVPFMAAFLAILQSGALGMQQSTGVPKSIVDTITAVFIIIATMELLFSFTKKHKIIKNPLWKSGKGDAKS